jgi:hypothetical protein
MLRSSVLAAVLYLFAPGAALGDTDLTIDEALARMYNFDFPASQEILNRDIAIHPQDPLPYALRASGYLFYELDRLGILESEFLIDDNQIAAKKKKLEPDPANREKFLQALKDVDSRVLPALQADPNDRDALFAMCIAQGVATDYMALVEKHQISSLSLAKRSNGYAQRLLKLDPKFYDAYLTAGITEYMMGSLPFFLRWFVHFDNINGSKEKGVQNLQMVAREGHYFKPFAKILLGIIALREKRPQEAHRLLAELTHDYPENPLFRKEMNKLSSKLAVNAN